MLQNNTETDACMIDLDRNKVFDRLELPEGDLRAAWMTKNGIDALAMPQKPEGTRGLLAWEMQTIPVGWSNWDKITPATLAAVLSSAQPLRETAMRVENTPATFLFKTREGGAGILQITGFTDNPRAVKFRYKLGHGTFPTQPTQIDFKFLKVEVPKGSHYIRLHFERDTNPGLGFEVTQDLLRGPNDEVPQPGFIDHRKKKWVGVGDGNVL